MMFLEQIKAPRMDVHLCDHKIFYSAFTQDELELLCFLRRLGLVCTRERPAVSMDIKCYDIACKRCKDIVKPNFEGK